MHEEILTTQTIYQGRVISLSTHDIRLPNGVESKRELVTHPGAVAVVAFDSDDRVLLVRQYRIAARRVMIEIPAGTLRLNEDPFQCAARELQEETGCKPGRMEPLGGIFVAPGYTTEFIHLFWADDLEQSPLALDEDEIIELDRVPLPDVIAMIERGDIIDGKTITAVLRVARLRGV